MKKKINLNDYVFIHSGSNRGKTGKVVEVRLSPSSRRGVFAWKLGIDTASKSLKHTKRTSEGPGSIKKILRMIDISNVFLYDSKQGPSKVGYKIEDGVKQKVLRPRNISVK